MKNILKKTMEEIPSIMEAIPSITLIIVVWICIYGFTAKDAYKEGSNAGVNACLSAFNEIVVASKETQNERF